ncbi:unnamed protein product [Spirodela intermedia]|uniref:ZF-HD dimerization-type domain-containing protein n=1 Tax=Spirodela intermedia TaxID=51605 RepID=A0A7I8J538_SPIIN|nr:unnamed protein product [Spirodela intermedia]CAA6665179.1 unnamed protein product [Spirodela intermedia]
MELHQPQHLQQLRPPPLPSSPPPPPVTQKPLGSRTSSAGPSSHISFSNGTLKKHRPVYPFPPPPPEQQQQQQQGIYRECMKNHAAAMGGHALDGCGEFMPSPVSTLSDPSSLTCAACGCHRNFHRRLLSGDLPSPPHHHHHTTTAAAARTGKRRRRKRKKGTRPAGLTGGPFGGSSSSSLPAATASAAPRKRFRTKFSAEQKERMQELSEKLGWRMQKRDDAMVEQCCQEMGVSRGVFKVWMHNNKHNFVGGPSSRRSAGAGSAGSAGGGGEATSSSGGAAAGGPPSRRRQCRRRLQLRRRRRPRDQQLLSFILGR